MAIIHDFAALALANVALSQAQRCHRLGHQLTEEGLGCVGFFSDRDRLARLSQDLYMAAGERRFLVFSDE